MKDKIPALKKERLQAYRRFRNAAQGVELLIAKNPPRLKPPPFLSPDLVQIDLDDVYQ